jgi:hypothetical protein
VIPEEQIVAEYSHLSLDNFLDFELMFERSIFFENDTVQPRRSQHARTLTPMNTRTQTLPQ